MLAGRTVGSGATAQLDLSPVEVSLHPAEATRRGDRPAPPYGGGPRTSLLLLCRVQDVHRRSKFIGRLGLNAVAASTTARRLVSHVAGKVCRGVARVNGQFASVRLTELLAGDVTRGWLAPTFRGPAPRLIGPAVGGSRWLGSAHPPGSTERPGPRRADHAADSAGRVPGLPPRLTRHGNRQQPRLAAKYALTL
jgi:hypothetical protein